MEYQDEYYGGRIYVTPPVVGNPNKYLSSDEVEVYRYNDKLYVTGFQEKSSEQNQQIFVTEYGL